MAKPQLVLDLGPRDHFQLIHGGHRANVAVATLYGSRWDEQMHPHGEAGFVLEAVASECYDHLDAFFSQSGFRGQRRRIGNVDALTSLWVDLDFYNDPRYSDLKPEEVLDQVHKANPWLPHPTLLIDSGRGCYLVWCLTKPLSPDQLPQWQMIEDALVSHLAPFGADPKAKDSTRVLRLTGTMHTLAGRPVQGTHLADPIPFAEIKTAVEQNVLEPKPAPSRKPKRQARKRGPVYKIRSEYTLHYQRLQDCYTLASSRAPMTDGRHRMLYAFAISAAWYCPTVERLVEEITDFAGKYFAPDPKYTGDRLQRRVQSVIDRMAAAKGGETILWNGQERDPRYKARNQTLISMLEITPEEQRGLSTIISPVEKARRRTERRRANGIREREAYLEDCASKTRDQVQMALKLQQQGLTYTDMAELLDCSPSWVKQLLRKGRE